MAFSLPMHDGFRNKSSAAALNQSFNQLMFNISMRSLSLH